VIARGRVWRIVGVVVAAISLLSSGACSSDDASTAPAGTTETPSTAQPSGSTTAPTGTDPDTSPTARATGPSAGCEADSPADPGTSDETIDSGGVERKYLLIVPDGYDGSTPLPLVFTLHSLTVDYHAVPGLSGLDAAAAENDFITVSPSGRLAGGLPYWNAVAVDDNYDLEFLSGLLDHLETTLCVDTGRVYSVGMSNGAQTSSLLGCRMGERIAGIGPVAGVEFNGPCSGPPIPVIAFHGDADPIVPYGGGGLNSVAIADMNFYNGKVPAGVEPPTGVDESMSRWADHNGCDPEPVEERISAEARYRTWQNCDAPTELYIVDNGGHSWPGWPQPAFESQFGHGTTDIDATALMFDFFSRS